jgi:hypothetical protein
MAVVSMTRCAQAASIKIDKRRAKAQDGGLGARGRVHKINDSKIIVIAVKWYQIFTVTGGT